MKKVVIVFSLIATGYACGHSSEEVKKPISVNVNPQIGAGHETSATTASAAAETGNTAAAPTAAAAPEKDGKALLAGSDCRACHMDKDKLVGPAYAEVAKKYTDKDIKKLAEKVLAGGTGVWGEIPMPPHASLSLEDAEAMVKYILTIK
ncbi:MAG TPA: c-type cytochrome [Agriterribacter sp.]|nr:c-type cytochrome [Agriterribacter sp.]